MSAFSDLLAQAEFGSPIVDRGEWSRSAFDTRFEAARTAIGMTEALGRWDADANAPIGVFRPTLQDGRVSDAEGNFLDELYGEWTDPEGNVTDIQGDPVGAPPPEVGGWTPPYGSRGGIYGIAAELLRTYGFSDEDVASLVEFIKESLIMGDDSLTITQRLRERPEYDRRFPAMKLRRDAGFNAISELQYVQLEDTYRQTLRAANMPVGFYDDAKDFETLIQYDVSGNEFQRRVSLAYQARDTANADVIKQLKELYNLDDEWVAAYYLDPVKTKDLIKQEQQMRSAELSTAVMNTVGAGLTKRTAERLEQANVGISDVPKLATRAGMLSQLIGEETFSASELAAGSFGIDSVAATKLRRRGETRLAPFAGNAGLLISDQGGIGLGAAST